HLDCTTLVRRSNRAIGGNWRDRRASVSGVAWLSRWEGRGNFPRSSHPAATCRGGYLRRHLDHPAFDAPILVSRWNDRGSECPNCGFRAPIVSFAPAARFRVARALEAPRKHPPPRERNRATHRIEDVADRLRLLQDAGHWSGDASRADRALRPR